ncbi:hypothetical protein QOT17_016319 [Balamuthia mandrillaris]
MAMVGIISGPGLHTEAASAYGSPPFGRRGSRHGRTNDPNHQAPLPPPVVPSQKQRERSGSHNTNPTDGPLSLVELSAIVAAKNFTKGTKKQVPAEVLEQIQKRMTREAQIEHLEEYREWHENGQLRKLQQYVNGKEHGRCLKWWPNGQLWHEKYCVDGQLHGPRRLWYKNGQLKWCANYKGGSIVHGECKWWHSNGQLRSEAHYRNDRLHGHYRFWSKNGQLWGEGYYFYGYRCTGLLAKAITVPSSFANTGKHLLSACTKFNNNAKATSTNVER